MHEFYRKRGKRILDAALASGALAALLPLLIVLAALSRALQGPGVLFRQRRPGLGGRPFSLWKFRTMLSQARGRGKLPDGERITRFGAFLRSTSLDELPELLNVLAGDMSLVGPRPLLMSYLGRYSPGQARRHEVRPGITGWAQVRGRNSLSWEEKFRLDVWYVDHCSLFLDLRILLLTLGKVASREGVSAKGHATMPEFFPSQEKI